jgi:hypothetical protein
MQWARASVAFDVAQAILSLSKDARVSGRTIDGARQIRHREYVERQSPTGATRSRFQAWRRTKRRGARAGAGCASRV